MQSTRRTGYGTGELVLESLYEGDRGPAVAQLQAKLAELNLYTGTITGQFDSQTKQALQALQGQYGLSEEAGYFGPKTWYALTFWSQRPERSLLSFAARLNRRLQSLTADRKLQS